MMIAGPTSKRVSKDRAVIDETHNPDARCWVQSADSHTEFPVQNLPLGIFSIGGGPRRPGTAIGGYVLDLAAVASSGLLDGGAAAAAAMLQEGLSLNGVLSLPAAARRALRRCLFGLLTDETKGDKLCQMLHACSACQLHLPVEIRDFTDFYAGIHHARAVGSLLRPENPLLPNYKYVPVGYHGRSSSIRVSGGSVVRPNGQVRLAGRDEPVLAPSRRLDYELELGFWIGGRSTLGDPVTIGDAPNYLAGVSLLNDWSARDIQAWEYQPLGPFLAKNFATTVSPWIVTAEALAPFRTRQPRRSDGDPAPLPYLDNAEDQQGGAFNIHLAVSLLTNTMRQNGAAPATVGTASATNLYWTPAQLIAHHSVNGCDIGAGDLFGSGTISGSGDRERGSLMECSKGGTQPVMLPGGESRTFLEDGDEVHMIGFAAGDGFRQIGFGSCSSIVMPARAGR